MPDEQLMEIWRRAGAHLDQARRSLTGPGDDAFTQFDEFWHHNELGLALDELAEVASAQRAPRVVWEELQAAATVMRLDSGDLETWSDSPPDQRTSYRSQKITPSVGLGLR